jgi:hypothetical protein
LAAYIILTVAINIKQILQLPKWLALNIFLNILLLEITLDLSNKQINTILYAVQGIGIVFVSVFLAAYLAGLPTTAVFHSESTIRSTLTILGIAFLAFILASVFLAAYNKRSNHI